MKVNISYIAATEPERLSSIHNQLLMERMQLDKDISLFLDENTWTMGEDYNSPIWKKYKTMNNQYSGLVNQINQVEYYMRVH